MTSPAGPPERHLGDRVVGLMPFAYLIPVTTILALLVAVYLHEARGVRGSALFGVVAIGPVVGFAVAWTVTRGTSLIAHATAHTMLGAGNLTPTASFSLEESLIARGRLDEARAGFESRLRQHPKDHDVRLALADLLTGRLDDHTRAERLYLEVRRGNPTARQDHCATDALVNLYRVTENRGRYLAELARASTLAPGTRAGEAARRELLSLKQEIGDDA